MINPEYFMFIQHEWLSKFPNNLSHAKAQRR